MSLFNFKTLIKKYSKVPPIALIEQGGGYDCDNGGEYVEGAVTKKHFEGAVVPLSGKELRYEENGTYSSEDRKLYCYEDFKTGQKIMHKEKTYTIDRKKDYSDFDDSLQIYFMKRSD